MKRVIDWDTFFHYLDKLHKQIKNTPVYFPYGAIVAISRGGLVGGTMLSHRMKLPLHVVDFHAPDGNGEGNGSSIEKSELHMYQRFSMFSKFDELEKYSYQRVLVFDDIYDTGNTMKFVRDELAKRVAVVDTAALVLNLKNGKIPFTYPTYYAVTNDPSKWVEFPWETTTNFPWE